MGRRNCSQKCGLSRLVRTDRESPCALGYAAVRYRNLPTYQTLISAIFSQGAEQFPSEDELRTNVDARLVAFEQ